jgi:uncharacterized membrane protein
VEPGIAEGRTLMAFCPKCGIQVADGTLFCPGCGTPIPQAAPAQNQPYGQPVYGQQVQNQPYGQQAQNQPYGQPVYGQQPQGKATNAAGERKAGQEAQKGMAVLSYFGFLFLIPLFAARDDEFVQFHVNQGIAVFLVEIAANIVMQTVGKSGGIIGLLLSLLAWIACFVMFIFSIIGIVHAAKGEYRQIPLIGKCTFIK